MNFVIIPFLMSMLLGRSIDLRSYIVGEDVFDDDDYVETPLYMRNTTYHVIQDTTFPFFSVGLPIDIVLRIKSGALSSISGALGLDGFIRATSWRADSVVVAVTTMVQTVHRELKADAPQLSGWHTRVDHQQTHYAQAITYGGWSAILYRYKCDITQDQETVRKILTEKLGKTGTLEESTIELWKEAEKEMRASKEIRGTVIGHVDTYSSIGHSKFVNSPGDIFSTIHRFEKDVGEVGGPLYIELKPLHELDNAYPVVEADPIADSELDKVNEVYDDLRDAKLAIQHWSSQTLVDFMDEDEMIMTKVLEHIGKSFHLFHHLASVASIYKPQDFSLLRAALHSYTKLLTTDQPTYQQLLLQMKEVMDPECENAFVHEIKGVLKVAEEEKIQMGKVNGGLEECKALCLKEKKCRAVGYVDKYITVENINRVVEKYKQCTIYFRSSKTAKTTGSGTFNGNFYIYDRLCY